MTRELLIVLVARVVQMVTAFVLLRVMTAQITPDELGKVTLIMTTAMFFTLILVSPIGNYINRHLNIWHQRGVLKKALSLALIYLAGVSVFSVFVVWSSYRIAGGNWNISITWLIFLVSGVVLFKTINMTAVSSLNILGRRVSWAVYTIMTLWLGLAASWLLTLYQPQAEYWVLGQLAGFAVAGIFALRFPIGRDFIRKESGSPEFLTRDLLQDVLYFSLPLALTTGLNWVQYQSYRFIFSEMVSLSYLGYFAAGYAVSAGIMSAFEATAQQYFFPRFYKSIEEVDEEEIPDVWNEYAALMVPMTILTGLIVVVLSGPLTHLLVDEKYWMASQFVMLGAFVEVGRVTGNIYGLAAHAVKTTKILILPQIIGALSVLVLLPVMLSMQIKYGVYISLILASLLYVLALHYVVKRQVGVVLRYEVFFPLLYVFPFVFIVFLLLEMYEPGWMLDGILLILGGLLYVGIIYNIYLKWKPVRTVAV